MLSGSTSIKAAHNLQLFLKIKYKKFVFPYCVSNESSVAPAKIIQQSHHPF